MVTESREVRRQLIVLYVAVGFFVATTVLAFLSTLFIPYKLFVIFVARAFRPPTWTNSFRGSGCNVYYWSHCGAATDKSLRLSCVQWELGLKQSQPRFPGAYILLKISDPSRAAGHPFIRLRQSLTTFMGYAFWKNCEKFDIRNHIRHRFILSLRDLNFIH